MFPDKMESTLHEIREKKNKLLEQFINSVCLIKTGSLLESILEKVNNENETWSQNVYTFGMIIYKILKYIQQHQCRDPNNRKIIICNKELQEILQVKVFSLDQLKELIAIHIEFHPKWTNEDIKILTNTHPIITTYKSNYWKEIIVKEKTSNTFYTLSFALRQLFIDFVPNFPEYQLSFKFSKIFSFFSYIVFNVFNRYTVNHNNPFIIICKDTPLAQVFQINALHKCQLIKYLKQHLNLINTRIFSFQ